MCGFEPHLGHQVIAIRIRSSRKRVRIFFFERPAGARIRPRPETEGWLMKQELIEVQKHYDSDPLQEWNRLQKEHPYEKYITVKVMERYIRPNDSILDVGGGPGHYSIHFSRIGHEVTLVDLASKNVEFAKRKARQYRTHVRAQQGNALDLSRFEDASFDAVFLMGPLYHLLDEDDRRRALGEARRVLKPGGCLFASFILMYGGVIYGLRQFRKAILIPEEKQYFDVVLQNRSLAFDAFTQSYMTTVKDAKALFAERGGWSIETVFSQEGVLAPYKDLLAKAPRKERMAWYEFGYRICENEDYLSHGEHLMVVARKQANGDAG